MSRARTIALSVIGLILLCFAPLIPTSAIFQLSINAIDNLTADPELTPHDVEEILRIVSDHPSFVGDKRYPKYISINDYVLCYTEIGVLGIMSVPDGWPTRRGECYAAVDIGMNCRGLCGVGTTFYMIRKDGDWAVKWTGKWVS